MVFDAQGSFELPALLVQADQALYRAKSDGRNRLVVVSADLPATAAVPTSDAIDGAKSPALASAKSIGQRSAA
jgi:hypothetical protein